MGAPHSSLCRPAVPNGALEKQGASGPSPWHRPCNEATLVKLRTATSPLVLPLALSFISAAAPLRAQEPANDPSLWPEAERAFFQDGPALLLSPEQRTELLALSPEARTRWIEDFLEKDPVPATPKNALRAALARRMALATDQFLSPRDVRAQIMFLNGLPKDRTVLDCAAVVKPLEIWAYPGP